MSSPPLLDAPRARRRRREVARRRRRRRLLACTAIVIVVVAGITGIVLRKSSHSHSAASVAKTPPKPPLTADTSPALSPAGIPLGHPPLTLRGIEYPAGNPVRIDFHHPPRAGLLFNLTSGQVLWQHNAFKRVPIASLTKMMTALIVVRSAPPHARVRVTRAAVRAAGSKVGVLPLGRLVPLETMLYGLMLPSGNDAAVALAQHISHSVRRFVAGMNAEAAGLGLGCTRYSSPSGYVDRGNFSCAADLAVLAHEDLRQPRLARIARHRFAVRPFPIKGGKLYLYNNNPLEIYRYPGVTGLKTGYTLAAGRCLVATVNRHGVRLGVVLLNSRNPATQARQLLDRAFRDVYRQGPTDEPEIPPEA